MTFDFLRDLTRQTLFAPRAAASRILALDLRVEWLWMALVLMSILNAVAYTGAMAVNPPSDPTAAQMVPAAFQSPVLFTIFLCGALAITVMVLTWIGQVMGGQGQVRDVLSLIVWMQVLRLMVQLLLLVLMLSIPFLGAILVLAASIWGLVILVCFIDRAHGFDNLAKAAGVLIACIFAMVVGLSALLGVLAAAIMGGG